jgi:hypothetical protein
MIRILPTPTSYLLYLALFVGIAVIGLILYAISRITSKGSFNIGTGILILWFIINLGYNSYQNYINSSSYIADKKEYKIKYSTDTPRHIEVLNYQGTIIFSYDGNFSFTRKGKGLNLTDNKTGKKLSVYIGDNDTITVYDVGMIK